MAFTDLHEIAEMFGRLEGQTSRLGAEGGYYVCHGPETRERSEYKRKWMAAKRKEKGWRALEKRRSPEVRRASGRKKQAAYMAKLKAEAHEAKLKAADHKAKPKEAKRAAQKRSSPEGAQKLRAYHAAYAAANKEKRNAQRAERRSKKRLDAKGAVDHSAVNGAG